MFTLQTSFKSHYSSVITTLSVVIFIAAIAGSTPDMQLKTVATKEKNGKKKTF